MGLFTPVSKCHTPFLSLICLLQILQLISLDYCSNVVTKLQIITSSMYPPRGNLQAEQQMHLSLYGCYKLCSNAKGVD